MSTTPLTSAFLDADSTATLFPRDFLLSLPRPEGYFGLREVHDGTSQTKSQGPAHIRTVEGGDRGLRQALDMFVLTAAIKTYRESLDGFHFPQHRMLVLGPRRVNELDALRTRIGELWATSDFEGPAGRERLRKLFESDLSPVSTQQRAALPVSFSTLAPSLDKALARIGRHPIHSGTDRDAAMFGTIVVTSLQAARSLDSSGLTIVYLGTLAHPSALPAVMAGLGFRAGYQDLIRLYIPDTDDGAGATTFLQHLDAYRRADEEIREELAALASLSPAEIPPLIATRLAERGGPSEAG